VKMPRNDLEQFIQDHRQEFDDAYPSLKLWTEIERELGHEATPEQIKPMRVRRMRWYAAAASVVMLMTLAGLGGHYLGRQSAPTAQEILDRVAPDFAEAAQYYNQEIGERYAQLASFTHDPQLDTDLAQIDTAMEELRAELAQAPPGREEQLVQELIASYRLKLQILERVLESLERSNTNFTPTTNSNSDETSI
jgi:hypothetical protein